MCFLMGVINVTHTTGAPIISSMIPEDGTAEKVAVPTPLPPDRSITLRS